MQEQSGIAFVTLRCAFTRQVLLYMSRYWAGVTVADRRNVVPFGRKVNKVINKHGTKTPRTIYVNNFRRDNFGKEAIPGE